MGFGGWVALSDREGGLGTGSADPILTKGSFIVEFELPLTGSTVLLDYRSDENWPRAISVFVDETAGVILLHRQGSRLVRHVLPGPLNLGLAGTARLSFSWHGPGRSWDMRLEQPMSAQLCQAKGRDPIPFLRDDLQAACSHSGGALRHRSVLWFGANTGKTPPTRAPWLGLYTPIETANGPCAAGDLRAGDLLLTADDELIAVQALRRMDLPSYGSYSPVLLRAPYFGADTDLLVSSDQLVAVSGPETEYLFAEEEVLVEAGHLCDGRAARKELRNAVTACVSIELIEPALILADGCVLLSHSHDHAILPADLPRRLLQGYEAIPLLAQLGRAFQRNAA